MESTRYLIFVDIKNGVQSNKYYNMIPNGDGFTVEYGRVDVTRSVASYPMSKWNSVLNSKLKKGYKDITDLKNVSNSVVSESSGNKEFDDFYNVFKRYTGDLVRQTYLAEGCSVGQLEEAQHILNKITQYKKVDEINMNLLELYKVIPRRMHDVRQFLIENPSDLDKIINREQEALDSMDSSNIINVSNPYKELGVDFLTPSDDEMRQLEALINPTNTTRHKIYKSFKIINKVSQDKFSTFVKQAENKHTELLIHGTRNPNIFSILKSGLMIRPTNAAVISGAAYGNGIYHSAHANKSLGYTGRDPDKIFLIQNVNMGKAYKYSGWYRDGKDISRSDMSYKGLRKLGYDSLHVEAGDGLLNSEYIVYKEEQTTTSYVVWLR
jgi:poly [ADP-ribose] polymerase 2/3/4